MSGKNFSSGRYGFELAHIASVFDENGIISFIETLVEVNNATLSLYGEIKAPTDCEDISLSNSNICDDIGYTFGANLFPILSHRDTTSDSAFLKTCNFLSDSTETNEARHPGFFVFRGLQFDTIDLFKSIRRILRSNIPAGFECELKFVYQITDKEEGGGTDICEFIIVFGKSAFYEILLPAGIKKRVTNAVIIDWTSGVTEQGVDAVDLCKKIKLKPLVFTDLPTIEES